MGRVGECTARKVLQAWKWMHSAGRMSGGRRWATGSCGGVGCDGGGCARAVGDWDEDEDEASAGESATQTERLVDGRW